MIIGNVNYWRKILQNFRIYFGLDLVKRTQYVYPNGHSIASEIEKINLEKEAILSLEFGFKRNGKINPCTQMKNLTLSTIT